MPAPLLTTAVPGLPARHGKVRDLYDFGDRLLLVATDRLSAFDHILPTGIPGKGRVLTQLSAFWFTGLVQRLGIAHHLLSTDPTTLPLPEGTDVESLRDRSMVTRRCEVLPIECVVRGYLAGSGWKEYRTGGTVCGEPLPPGLTNAAPLPHPIFTPATKAEQGEHDENISFPQAADLVGQDTAEQLRELSLRLYEAGRDHAAARGIVLADTKFEFGRDESGQLLLIDEVMTPDSSRYWPADAYEKAAAAGENPPSFDKQFVRDWLERTDWNKTDAPPPLPAAIVEGTTARYHEAYRRLTGNELA